MNEDGSSFATEEDGGDSVNDEDEGTIDEEVTEEPIDDLLGDRTIIDDERPSAPQRADGDVDHDTEEGRPLPLTVLTQTKNHRELLDYFLTADIPDEGYNKTDIADESGVSTNGIRRHIDTFLDFGVVEMTTDEGAYISRYTNNKDSDVHRSLRAANNALAMAYQENSE